MSGELLFGPRHRRTFTHHASHSQYLHHRHFRNHIHLWAGMVRDILGSPILKFPQEPAVYFHVSLVEARRLVEEEDDPDLVKACP